MSVESFLQKAVYHITEGIHGRMLALAGEECEPQYDADRSDAKISRLRKEIVALRKIRIQLEEIDAKCLEIERV